jgi:arylsulfatase A-like enzyme
MAGHGESTEASPSILFLIIDCLRADRASSQARLQPNGFIGRLVRRGRCFTNAVTVTPTTTPAFATMLTGRYPFEHGIRGLLGFTRSPDLPTIASALRVAEYRTEADVTGPLVPSLRLFDEFDDYRYANFGKATLHGPRGDDLARRVRELQHDGGRWFLLVHVWDVHTPRRVPKGFSGRSLSRTIYDRALAALDARLSDLLPDDVLEGVTVCLIGDHGENLRFEPRGKIGKGISNLLWDDRTKDLLRPVVRRYLAYGAHSSSKRALRLAPRAIILHGQHLFEPLIRVPYILAGAGISAGTSDALVTHTDLAPTFAGLAGVWFDGGVGAVPLPLEGEGDPHRRVVLETAWVTPLRGVAQVGLRTVRWKYMEVAGGAAPALFDLENDPGERRNLVRKLPEVASELREELHAALALEGVAGRMSDAESEVLERRLEELGYID